MFKVNYAGSADGGAISRQELRLRLGWPPLMHVEDAEDGQIGSTGVLPIVMTLFIH